jgi:hypothetical protein
MADKRELYTRSLFVMALFASGALSVFFHLGVDGDHLWSIAVGRWIAENRAVPWTDPFSWITYGEAWITHQWLFTVTIYYAERMFGDLGIRAVAAFGFVSASAVLCLFLRRHREKSIYWFYSAAIFLVTAMAFAKPRAYYFTYFLFLAALYLWYLKRQSKYLWLLPLLTALWANLHSMAVVFAVLFLFDALAGYIFTRDKRLIAVSVSALAATLFTPYGVRLWQYVFELQFVLTEHTKVVTEWLPVDLGNPLFFLCFAAMVYFQTKATFHFLKSPGAKPFCWNRDWSLLVVSWAILLYAITSVRFWLFYIGFLLSFLASLEAGAPVPAPKPSRRIHIVWAAMAVVLLVNGVFLVKGAAEAPLHKPYEFPLGAAEFLVQNPRYQERLFTGGWYSGSWLLYRGLKSFYDDRGDVFVKAGIFDDIVSYLQGREDPEKFKDRFGINSVLVKRNGFYEHYYNLHPGFELVYTDDYFVIYTRKGGVNH